MLTTAGLLFLTSFKPSNVSTYIYFSSEAEDLTYSGVINSTQLRLYDSNTGIQFIYIQMCKAFIYLCHFPSILLDDLWIDMYFPAYQPLVGYSIHNLNFENLSRSSQYTAGVPAHMWQQYSWHRQNG